MSNRDITRAIKKATGIDGIKVEALGGVCRFVTYDDAEYVDELEVMLHDFDSIYVYRICHQTTEQWVADFQFALNQYRADHPPRRPSTLIGDHT